MNRRELRARLIWLSEALEAGDNGTALAVVLDLLDELADPVPPARCPDCGLPFEAPGLVARHLSIVHGRAA